MNSQFSWIAYYQEFAKKILSFRSDRQPLLKFIYSLDSKLVGYLHENDKSPLNDICPFTVMGIFNRGITNDNRTNICEQFKEFLKIKSDAPKDFEGIPVINNLKSYFFTFDETRQKNDIENLWQLFEIVQKDPNNIENIFNEVRNQPGININITMGLYWIMPEKFVALDSHNRKYLSEYGINTSSKVSTYNEYFDIVQNIQNKMKIGEMKEKSFPELSLNAWQSAISTSGIMTFQEFTNEFRSFIQKENNILNQFTIKNSGSDYFWIADDKEIIGTQTAHYEFYKIGNVFYLDLHFEEKKSRDKFSEVIKELPSDINWFNWSKSKSLRLDKEFKLDEENLLRKTADALLYFETELGDKIRGIIKSLIQSLVKTIPLNQILYGPPGTGKTYNTINKAVAIINPEFDITLDRKLVNQEYDRLVKDGQIIFTTFHQSMSYEDFIEGIKPETIDNEVVYEVKPGIFKLICEQAKTKTISNDNFEEIYNKFLEEINKNNGKLVLESIIHAKEFTVYVNSKNNLRFHANTEKHYEGVIKKNVLEHYLKTNEALDWPSYVKAVGSYLVSNYNYTKKEQAENKNFVLIIDEINRGNVSQIFGELITLIEEDKRLGNSEALEVILPYSKEKFGVPSNLYIIGTMNTADRSVEALDTALRRRFSFEEVGPKSDLFKIYGKAPDGIVADIDLTEVLETINKRIEVLLDKDHQIGHSYFLSVESISDLKLVFQNKIIPLLQEYFFGDYGKIGLVLGSGFVTLKEKEDNIFADFDKNYDASDLAERDIYQIKDIVKMDENELKLAINKLLNIKE